ncbi:GNAT family N-acetyltransferase [Paraburkholderia bannensis]|uniref:GNAT family N-acetyltransferase n=1 Tax=Paraburkholderia bannensis TaxID=765414 RepID=UPI002AC31F81|nr:GNAT family protein [Paraburkholderia bannensis]
MTPAASAETKMPPGLAASRLRYAWENGPPDSGAPPTVQIQRDRFRIHEKQYSADGFPLSAFALEAPFHSFASHEADCVHYESSRAILSGDSTGSPETSEVASLIATPFDSAILSTARIRLEPLVAAHAATMFEGLIDPANYRYIPQEPPATVDDLTGRYRKLESRRSPDGTEAWLNWALMGLDGNAHGYVQATIQLNSKEAWIAYFVFSPSQRLGYAKEALDGLLPALREAYGIVKFNAEIDTRNIASIRLVESLGFARIRHVENADEFKGAISDEYHYSL